VNGIKAKISELKNCSMQEVKEKEKLKKEE
jgi:hypothetical protein